MADWAGERVGLSFIPPGESWRNGYESFNSRVRDEWLNINSFWSLAQARVVISDWKEDYNHRPATQLARLPGASGLRCRLHPQMNDSHTEWINSRVRPLQLSEDATDRGPIYACGPSGLTRSHTALVTPNEPEKSRHAERDRRNRWGSVRFGLRSASSATDLVPGALPGHLF